MVKWQTTVLAYNVGAKNEKSKRFLFFHIRLFMVSSLFILANSRSTNALLDKTLYTLITTDNRIEEKEEEIFISYAIVVANFVSGNLFVYLAQIQQLTKQSMQDSSRQNICSFVLFIKKDNHNLLSNNIPACFHKKFSLSLTVCLL